MLTNKLNEAKCRAAKAGEKPVKLFDGGGLYLFVSPTGSKTWRVSYRVGGKAQQKSLGPYPDVSLAEARKKRDELKGQLRDGVDPMRERRARRSGLTLEAACRDFWSGRKDVSESYRQNALRALEMHLWPGLGNVPINAIDRSLLLAELQRIDAKGLHEYVRKTRMWVGQVFEWAVENEHCAINPALLINPEKAFGKSAVESFAALDPRDMPDFVQRLNMERDLQSVLACRMLAYTWVRTNELRNMLWSEIDGDVWLIPAGKMKRGKDHLVPLSRQAVDVLTTLKARSRDSAYVFPAEHRDDRPMSENTVLYLIHRIGYKGRMTGHGFRSVASTWANERGYNPDAIERQLAHVPGDKVRAVYNRAAYLPERRAMLQDFADWFDSCGQVDAV